MTRGAMAVLAGVLLGQSLVVAGVFTPEPHSGGDNAGYVALAHSLLDRGSYQELWDPAEPPHTKYPPVFPVLLAAAVLLGAKSWGALKVVPAFATVLAVAFTFLWARERKGLLLGVVVALLVGLSESVVYYSQWILSDPAFLAMTMAALWAFQRSSRTEGKGDEGGLDLWLGAGMVLAVLAYFTRSAGLPLAVAVAVRLGMARRWRALGVFAAVFGIPAVLWWLRGRFLGGSQYVSEFWLLDPYQPQLGTVGPVELLQRFIQNLEAYVTTIIPGGIVGDSPPMLAPLGLGLGLGLGLVTLVGWIRSLRERPGVAEIFFPLYLGLILLWPLPWSGDRFSLPLLPLMFFYSGVALPWLLGAGRRVRVPVTAVLVLLLAVPAGLQWLRMAGAAGACRASTRSGEPMACLSPPLAEYVALADWSGRNLPDGAVVTTRKPRIFFVMSGVKARSIPLVRGSELFLAEVRRGESRYVSLDGLDGLSGFYVYPVLMDRLNLFCGVMELGPAGQGSTRLFGLLDPGRLPATSTGRALSRCPADMFRGEPREGEPLRGWGIPILARD